MPSCAGQLTRQEQRAVLSWADFLGPAAPLRPTQSQGLAREGEEGGWLVGRGG